MKVIVEKMSEVDSRIKMLLLVAFAYFGLSFGFNHVEAMTTLENYTPAINVMIKDGTNEVVGQLVKQSTAKNIIKDLGIVLNDEDYLNLDDNALVEDYQTIEIHRITYKEEVKEEEIPFDTIKTGDVSDDADVEITTVGQNGLKNCTYRIRLDDDTEVSRELIKEEVTKEPISQVENYTDPKVFTGRLTTYGGDCSGCTGRTASGVTLNANGANGSGSAQVYYNGGWYYVLAADASIPFGTIIEISNHNLNLPDVIYGVVLDRGGAISGGNIDIFYGQQSGVRFFSGGTSYNTTFRIVG